MFAKVRLLEREQKLPLTLDESWQFFSDPRNLPKITPPELHFDVSQTRFDFMYPGQILRYRLKPMLGIPIRWTTEITHVVKPTLFVDEQRFGPYLFWHHQHLFEPIPGGLLMRDFVHYALPGGPFGDLLYALSVGRQLRRIFDFRAAVLKEMFGELS